MYRNILLAYDGSLEGRVALREGALRARRLEARAFLLGVTTQPQLVDPASGVVAVNSEAVAVFEDGLQKARDLGLEVQGEQKRHPRACITDIPRCQTLIRLSH